MLWIEVLDQDESQPGVAGQRGKELRERLQPTGGGADAYDEDGCSFRVLCRAGGSRGPRPLAPRAVLDIGGREVG